MNRRLAYVAVSRARYEVQIYTNDKAQLVAGLQRDVSQRSAVEATEQLARAVAERRHDADAVKTLDRVGTALEPSRLAREDTLACESMTQSERRWLRTNRPPAAEHWNLLTGLTPDHLSYAS